MHLQSPRSCDVTSWADCRTPGRNIKEHWEKTCRFKMLKTLKIISFFSLVRQHCTQTNTQRY